MPQARRPEPTVAESLREYARGIGGGFLFSPPLLLTMEVWATGIAAEPLRLLVALAGTFVLLCGYNAFAGLHHDARISEILVDSVEELGIGLALSAVILWMLGRIGPSSGVAEALGLVLVEGFFVAVGVSVGTAQLTGGGNESRGVPKGRQQSVSSELVLAFCGAVLIAANVAPTEEVLMLASGMRPPGLLATMLVSIAVAATLLYYSNFTGSARFAGTRGPFAVVSGTAITYATGLVASATLLWFFGRLEQHNLALNMAQCVVLGFAATLGAAAGQAPSQMKKNALEWTVFALSLVLIGGIAILLAREHFSGGNGPPSITVSAGEAVETGGRYAVPIDVRNVGDTTAENVQVEGSLTWAGGSERGEAVLSFVPYGSQRRAWIGFSHDPRNGKLEIRVLGYREP